MSPLWQEAVKTVGPLVTVLLGILYFGAGEKPKWVYYTYLRDMLKQRDDQHAAEMVRRDVEYKAAISRIEEDLISERKRSEGWQQKYVNVLETAHAAVRQTVEVVAATSGKAE